MIVWQGLRAASGSFRHKPWRPWEGGWCEVKGAAVQANSLMGLKTPMFLPGTAPIKKSEQQVSAAGRQRAHLLVSFLFCALRLVLSLSFQICPK